MVIDALLSYAHIAAFLTWTVFLTSQTALLRPQWFNAAVLERLVKVEAIARWSAVGVLVTGVLRLMWGAKGPWPLGQPLMWGKVTLFAVMAIEGYRVGLLLRSWHDLAVTAGALPTADAVDALRKRVLRAAHLMVVIPLLAVLLARGLLTL